MGRLAIVYATLTAVLFCCAAVLVAGAVSPGPSKAAQRLPYNEIGNTVLIDGDLGRPVGSVVRIQGYKQANGPLANWFWVERIDGKPLETTRGVLVSGISNWKDGTKATLTGYEIGILKFRSLKETNFGPDDPRWHGPHQVLDLTFEVERVEEPSELILDRK
jgi:hypothetical protein